MGFFYVFLLTAYCLGAVLIVWVVKRLFRRRWITVLAVLIIFLFPFYDVLIQSALLKYYSSTRTLQQIARTVDSPSSVYWEDNVWPGFDEKYQLWMIDHLLDGKHLSNLAMNGPSGKVYLYRYGQGDKPTVFESMNELPSFNYHIRLSSIQLPWWQKHFLLADRIEITDTRNNEIISYSERFMAFSPRLYLVKSQGGSPFEGGNFIGDRNVYAFDDKYIFSGITIKRHNEGYRSIFSRWNVSHSMRRYIEKR